MKIRHSMSHKPLGQAVCVHVCAHTRSHTHTHTCTHVLVMGEGKPRSQRRLPEHRDFGP